MELNPKQILLALGICVIVYYAFSKRDPEKSEEEKKTPIDPPPLTSDSVADGKMPRGRFRGSKLL